MKSKIEENDGILGGSVIYNGIDEKDLDIALHGRHSQNKDIDVFSLCGYGKNKGIDFLLETLRQMPMSFSAVIGGNFRPDNNFVPSEGKVFNSINFYGSMNTADIVDMFLRSKVYVQPSRFESFSIPVLEAMYCGIPPIVSKGAGVFELIEDGVNGFVFNYGDTKKLITSILQIIRGEVDYAQLSKNAKETAKQHLQKHMAKEYLNLFRKAVMN
jgi:glycosyltransferase involved in cell wall biosynthesis